MIGSGAALDAIHRVMQARARMLDRRQEREDQVERLRDYSAHLTAPGPGSRMIAAQAPSPESRPHVAPSSRLCPKCRAAFIQIRFSDVDIEFCDACCGTWFDAGELASVTHQAADVPDGKYRSWPRLSRCACPVCHTRLRRRRYHRPQKLWVDECPAGHGVFLEGGEIAQALAISKSP